MEHQQIQAISNHTQNISLKVIIQEIFVNLEELRPISKSVVKLWKYVTFLIVQPLNFSNSNFNEKSLVTLKDELQIGENVLIDFHLDNPNFTNQIVKKNFPTIKLNLLKLRMHYKIFLSEECLKQVKHLYLEAIGSWFFIKFETLSIKYPSTRFTINFDHFNDGSLNGALIKYCELFYVQKCTVVLGIQNDQYSIIEKWKNTAFPQNLLEAQLYLNNDQKHANQLQLDFHTLCSNTDVYCRTNFNFQLRRNQIIPIQTLRITISTQSEQIFSQKSLCYFKISDQFYLQFGKTLKIIESNEKCESPKKISLECADNVPWINKMILLLRYMTNQSNTVELHIKNKKGIIYFNNDRLDLLYDLTKQFCSLRVLTIPFGLNRIEIDGLKQLLQELKCLAHLTLNALKIQYSFKESNAVEEISQFAITEMAQLKTLNFTIWNKIWLDQVVWCERAAPLTIQIHVIGQRTLYLIDTRMGLKIYRENIVIQKLKGLIIDEIKNIIY
ncbi:hypothetical protein FGO68_gene10438 [Halteria grandinella]|uniref:Uncharacterized protein n=1 Tax=Halteria grandinella TaxID=5974 RepID=A0A8J8T3G8_HALGN|nr:hypothetical protein FGO68_gene10438 [Halteria grandinella]